MELNDFTYFYPEKPRLAQVNQALIDSLDDSPDWVAEPKYNGSRLQLHHLPTGEFQFWSRHGERLVYQPSSEIMAALRSLRLNGYWLFDGELRHNKVEGVKHRIVIYDLFICGGKLLHQKPFRDRRGILDVLFHYHGVYDFSLDLAPQYDGDFRAVFHRLTADPEIEGLVIKNRKGRLALGRTRAVDSSWMWKIRKPSGRYNY